MGIRLGALLVGGLLGLTACGAADDTSDAGSSNKSSPAVDDDGRGLDGDWIVDSLTVDGMPIDLDPTRPVTVTIDGDDIGGTAACNSYRGRIDLTAEAGHGTFTVTDLSWTEMGCEPDVMAVEQAFLSALQMADSYESADGLYVAVADGDTNFHLTRAQPTPTAPLTGTTWVLDTYLENDSASNWPDMADVTIVFADDGTLHGQTACALFDGSWALDGNQLSLSRVDRIGTSPSATCDDGDAELDALVFDVLRGTGLTTSVDGRRLSLESEGSGAFPVGLSFVPADGTETTTPDPVEPTAAGHSLGGGVDGPVMYAARRDGGDVMAAEIIGTLELDGECLYTVFDGIRYPVLWPYGTTWNAEAKSVVLPDGSTLAMGDEVYGGGGYLYADTIGGFTSDDAIERAALCAEDPYGEIAVLQTL
ncbi:MAG: META domain-containing protein [Ilumatobacter sp.]|nr:META domain-containing protein [Ilumatobacter sp.]